MKPFLKVGDKLQHGDVLITKISELPTNAKEAKKDSRGVVLAEGEHTGHFHAVEDITNATLYENGDALFFEVNEKTSSLTHQEHGKIDVPSGLYSVTIVQEFDHFEEEARKVRD